MNVFPAVNDLVTGTTALGLEGVLLSFWLPDRTVSEPVDATENGSEKSKVAVEDPALATLM